MKSYTKGLYHQYQIWIFALNLHMERCIATRKRIWEFNIIYNSVRMIRRSRKKGFLLSYIIKWTEESGPTKMFVSYWYISRFGRVPTKTNLKTHIHPPILIWNWFPHPLIWWPDPTRPYTFFWVWVSSLSFLSSPKYD